MIIYMSDEPSRSGFTFFFGYKFGFILYCIYLHINSIICANVKDAINSKRVMYIVAFFFGGCDKSQFNSSPYPLPVLHTLTYNTQVSNDDYAMSP